MSESKLNLDSIKGLLIDINGTLYFKDEIIPNSIETIQRLEELGVSLIYLTNTDSKTPYQVWKTLKKFTFPIKQRQVFTPIIALKRYLKQYPKKKSYFILSKQVEKEFEEFPRVKESEIPDFVVLGDFRDDWDIHRLNKGFKYILNGARLLGTQGNKYFLDNKGEPVLDTGAFTSMIANIAKIEPKIFGKPAKSYFELALNALQLRNDQVLLIGDDIESDIKGAINAGIQSILVKTGKAESFKQISPNARDFIIIDSFPHILDLFSY
ncbi:MAG: hypothetical protein BAJALOKI2v1_80014 [Promethearchaeota archaeon]|nr:MAG: hypothetical protein BAJALOKI2v1_80014 [Candidatus Lokiarchaeota archaeon]